MNSRSITAAFSIALSILFVERAFAAEPNNDGQIRKLVETEVEGASTHDINKVMSVYWHNKDFVLYDAIPGKFVGWDALKTDYEDYFKEFPQKPEATIDELHVGSTRDMGYAASIQTWKFKKADGTVVTSTQRVTNVYRKINGQWLCVHEHASMPIQMMPSKLPAAANK